jgi:hypothetical protein
MDVMIVTAGDHGLTESISGLKEKTMTVICGESMGTCEYCPPEKFNECQAEVYERESAKMTDKEIIEKLLGLSKSAVNAGEKILGELNEAQDALMELQGALDPENSLCHSELVERAKLAHRLVTSLRDYADTL